MKNRMHKGVTLGLRTILGLVLVILVAVVAFLALTYASDIMKHILGLLGEPNELTEAIKCAYYRCTEGCAVAEGIVDSDVFDCSLFCSAVPAAFRDQDGKICNENAKLYPVELVTTEDIEISKNMLSDEFDCITNRGEGSGWDVIDIYSQFWGQRLLGVDESYITSYGEEGTCAHGLIDSRPDYESVTLSPNSYGIVGVRNTGGLWPFKWDYKKAEIYTEEELSEMVCQSYGESTCAEKGCKWCSLCEEEKMNKFGKDICILPTEDCEYEKNCVCYNSEEDCTADDECFWCDSLSFCIQEELKDECPTEIVRLPPDGDAWTEYQTYIDNNCWIGAFPAELRSEPCPSCSGSNSFYGEGFILQGLTFNYFGCPSYLGETIDIDYWDKLHFWFKGLEDSATFQVIFSADDMGTWEMICNLGNYNAADGWKEYTVDLQNDCYWLTEKKPIHSFGFNLLSTVSGGTAGYIDNLYFYKSLEACEVSDTSILATPNYPTPGGSISVYVYGISPCIGRKARVYLEHGGSSVKCGEKTVDEFFGISCSVPSDWPEGTSSVWVWVDEDNDESEESGEYTLKEDVTVTTQTEDCFYGTLQCGLECRDYLGHGDYLIGCYKYGCPSGYTDLGDAGCSTEDSSCTHCCCKDLSE